MVEFRYQAVDRSGKILNGRILAESREQAISKIKSELGLIPTEVKEEVGRVRGGNRLGGSKQNFVLNFSQQMANLLNSGIQIDDALTVLIQLTGDSAQRELIREIQEDIQGGSDLSQALAKHPAYFNESYINMIKAGESGGVLGLCIQRLTDYLEQDRQFKGSIKSALLYPMIVLLMGIGAVIILFIVVIPRFVGIFDSLGQELPLPTRILLGISSSINLYWPYMLVGLAVVIGGIFAYVTTSEGRYQLDKFLNGLPFLGQVRIKLTVSRFTRILGTMLDSGVPLLKGLEIAKNTLNNKIYIKIIGNLYEHVRKGGTLIGFLQTEPAFPDLAVFLIGVGERTGNLENMLNKVADTLAFEVQKTLKNFLTILEPIIILFLGLFVVFVVLSILLPIFSLNELPF